MEKREFTCSITANITAKEALEKISQVSEWWVADVEGETKKLNDVFTVHAGTTWKAFKIIEVVPDKKVVWLVTDCNLPWNTDLTEWKNTKIVWEVSTVNDAAQISFTHVGLAELDCAGQCEKAWSSYIKESLFKFITQGKGLPNKY
jgi:hypothetical protein